MWRLERGRIAAGDRPRSPPPIIKTSNHFKLANSTKLANNTRNFRQLWVRNSKVILNFFEIDRFYLASQKSDFAGMKHLSDTWWIHVWQTANQWFLNIERFLLNQRPIDISYHMNIIVSSGKPSPVNLLPFLCYLLKCMYLIWFSLRFLYQNFEEIFSKWQELKNYQISK